MSTEIFYDSDVLPQENESIDLRGQEIICFTSGRGKPVKMVWGELASGRNLQIQQKMEGKNVLKTPDFSPRKERDGDAVVPFFFSQQLFVKPKSLTSTSFVLSPAPPCHGMTPLTRPSTRRDYFCGGSRRHICPADSYCHISPSDAFAKCCSGRTCLISFNP